MWKCYSVSTANWGDKIELPAADFTGGRALNTGRDGSTIFDVGDPGVDEVITAEAIKELERVLVATWNENAVYAGLIVDVDEDKDASSITVKHHDIWWILQRRYLLNARDNTAAAAAPITWSGRSLPTLANLIVAKGLQGEPADQYDLPVIFSADVAGPEDRTYYGYEFLSVAAALDEIIKSEGGPYVEFDSRWGPGTTNLEWVMRSGALTDGLWEWDATAQKTDVTGLKLATSAQNVADKIYGTGEGSERDRLVRTASSFSASPALERVINYGSKTLGELQSRTTGGLHATNDSTQQISFSIPVDGAVSVADLRLGGTARLKSEGFRRLADGWHDWRLIQFDFNKDSIDLQFQQIGG